MDYVVNSLLMEEAGRTVRTDAMKALAAYEAAVAELEAEEEENKKKEVNKNA